MRGLGLLAAERRLREPEKPAREGKSFAPPKFSLTRTSSERARRLVDLF